MPSTKKQTALRLHPDTKQLLEDLSADTGLTQTGVVELAIRDLAKVRGVKVDKKEAEA